MVNCFSLIMNGPIDNTRGFPQNKGTNVMHSGESFQAHRFRTESTESALSYQSTMSPLSSTPDRGQQFVFPNHVKTEMEDEIPFPAILADGPPRMARQYSIGTVLDVIKDHDINDIGNITLRTRSDPVNISPTAAGPCKIEMLEDPSFSGFPQWSPIAPQWSPGSSDYSMSPSTPFENYQQSPDDRFTPQINDAIAMSPPEYQPNQWNVPTCQPTYHACSNPPATSTIDASCLHEVGTDNQNFDKILQELEKIDRRRIRNNEACKASRMRRKQRKLNKELELETLLQKNSALRQKVDYLQIECKKARQQLFQASV